MSVQRCKRETLSSEVLEWKLFLQQQEENKWKKENFEPIHYFLAAIALEVQRTIVKPESRNDLKLSDFLLKFTTTKPKVETPEERLKRSKQIVGAILGAGFRREQILKIFDEKRKKANEERRKKAREAARKK